MDVKLYFPLKLENIAIAVQIIVIRYFFKILQPCITVFHAGSGFVHHDFVTSSLLIETKHLQLSAHSGQTLTERTLRQLPVNPLPPLTLKHTWALRRIKSIYLFVVVVVFLLFLSFWKCILIKFISALYCLREGHFFCRQGKKKNAQQHYPANRRLHGLNTRWFSETAACFVPLLYILKAFSQSFCHWASFCFSFIFLFP